MGMDAYALKFKGLVAFSEISELFDEYGNLTTWQDRDWSMVDYSSPRIKEWCSKTLPGFDESIHAHVFKGKVDYQSTITSFGITDRAAVVPESFTHECLVLRNVTDDRLTVIDAEHYVYFPQGEQYVFVKFEEEGYIRKPFFDYWQTAEPLPDGNYQLSNIVKAIDKKQIDDRYVHFVTQSEISQLTPFINDYDRKNWDKNFNQPNTIVHLNW